jgi:hypothetical protein
LVVKLKRGWRYDPKHKELVSARGKRLSVQGLLPKRSEIVYAAPALAGADPSLLSAAELDLARYVHVVLPAKTRPEDLQPSVAAWECVAEARLPPEISLP